MSSNVSILKHKNVKECKHSFNKKKSQHVTNSFSFKLYKIRAYYEKDKHILKWRDKFQNVAPLILENKK